MVLVMVRLEKIHCSLVSLQYRGECCRSSIYALYSVSLTGLLIKLIILRSSFGHQRFKTKKTVKILVDDLKDTGGSLGWTLTNVRRMNLK